MKPPSKGPSANFDFGQNWQAFSEKRLTSQMVSSARTDFMKLLDGIDLKDSSFLDIGFGQGLSLLCAAEAGAQTVGCDINPLCAEVLAANRSFFPALAAKQIPTVIGSILDERVLQHLRDLAPDKAMTYSIVHSWGVLHHTGDMDLAIKNAASLVRPGGHLIIAIYNRHWSSPLWKAIKYSYGLCPPLLQRLLVLAMAPIIWLAKLIVTGANPANKERGMSFYYDVIDWVGGYPYEYAAPSAIEATIKAMGFETITIKAAEVPTGCNEFIFRKKPDTQESNDRSGTRHV